MPKPTHLLLAPLLVLGTAAGCAHDTPTATTIVVPTDAVAGRAYAPDGSAPARRYVVRMSDGKRDWEVEFPEVATGYELAIPLEEDPGAAGAPVVEAPGLTDADMELLTALRRENPDMERQGVYVDGRRWPSGGEGAAADAADAGSATQVATGNGHATRGNGRAGPARPEDASAPSRPSYLLGVDEVQRLYRAGQHEVALVKLVALADAYPGDPRLLAMKGSLWLKLGRPDLAAEAWEAALRIDPSDRSLVRALKRLRDLERRDDARESTP